MADPPFDQKTYDFIRGTMEGPVFEIAGKLGLIPPDIKNAILVAQAAERTQRLAERAENISQQLNEGKPAPTEGCVEPTDNVFKFVGSERDDPRVKYAQGMWMAAQIFFNNEARSANKQGAEAIAGFKLAACELYYMAGGAMEKAGQKNTAEKLRMVSEELGKRVKKGKAPEETIADLYANFKKSGIEDKPLDDAYKKVIGLIANHPAGPGRHDRKYPANPTGGTPQN
ncbi:MAG: hypothetical protein WC464_03440 [Bdellovibrionales bacterium]